MYPLILRHSSSLALRMALLGNWSVGWPIPLTQAEISQQLFDGLTWNLVLNPTNFGKTLTSHHELANCGFE